jgi:hypothetical protein
MTAFSTAWSLLKDIKSMGFDTEGDPLFTIDDIRELQRRRQEEKDTGIYNQDRGRTALEQLMGIFPLRQQSINPSTGVMNPIMYTDAEKVDAHFKEGYKERMDTSPRSSPAKVVRIPESDGDEYGRGIMYQLQDEKGNMLSQLGATAVEPEYNRYGRYVKNTLPMLVGLHGKTPQEHQRKGYYQQLLNTILHNNMNILSTSRNYNSQPFHESFQRRLPPSIDFNQLKLPYDDIETSQKYLYQPNPIKQSKERQKYQAAGWGDLQPDYGVVPMFDEPNSLQDEKLTNMVAQGYPIQTQLSDKRFLPQRNPKHPNHSVYYNYFTTSDGVPYSTLDVMQDLYNDKYHEHPYSRSLGHLFG